MRTRLLLAAVVLALPGAAWADHIKDPAEVLPAKTIAYAELRQPGQFAKEVASLFEGSALGNVPDSLAQLFDGHERPRHLEGVGAVGLLFSPEVIREVRRLRGAGIALTGMGRMGPEWVAIVLPGDSNGPAFLLRVFLSTGPVRPAGQFEGVRLYQLVMGGSRIRPPEPRPEFSPREKPRPRDGERDRDERSVREDRPPQEAREEGPPLGPVFALTDEALLIGSVDAVKDVVRRVKGKAKEESLADSKTFNNVRKEVGDQPGVFVYADVAGAMTLLPKELPGIGRHDLEALHAFKELINPKAFQTLAYDLGLEKGTLRYRKLAVLDPKEKSPLLDLLPTAAVPKDLLQFTPPDTVLAAALANNNAKERWDKFLKLADSIAKLGGGRDRSPSEEVERMEKQLGIDIGKDVLGRITGVAFAMGNPMDAPVKRTEKKGENFRSVSVEVQIPLVFVVRATGTEAAKALTEEVLPKIIAQVSGKDEVRATSKEIEGTKVHRFALREEHALHYARKGKTIVLGPYAKPVAQALANGAKERGWVSDEKVAERLGKLDDTIMVVAARPFTLIGAGLYPRPVYQGGSSIKQRSSPPKDTRPPPEKRSIIPPAPGQVLAVVEDKEDVADREEAKFKQQFGEALKKEGLLIMRVTRKPGRVLAEMTLTDLKPTVARLTDFGLKAWLSEQRKATRPRVESNEKPSSPDGPPRDR
jgi:hypothetical protein